MTPLATGRLEKMSVDHQHPVSYQLNVGQQKIDISSYLGQKIMLRMAARHSSKTAIPN